MGPLLKGRWATENGDAVIDARDYSLVDCSFLPTNRVRSLGRKTSSLLELAAL